MNNPSLLLSKEDIKLLETNNVNIPNKSLNDEEWDEFIKEITININQDDSERIIDLLVDEHL